jgi:CheY-like chemotaxis protein
MDRKQTGEDGSAPYAPEIVALLRRTRFLAMGFERSEFLRIAEILSSAGAAHVSCETDEAESCHAMLASVPAVAAMQPRAAQAMPLLIVGTPEEIVRNIVKNIVGQPLTGVDFLATPWTPAELIARAFRLVASSPRGPAMVRGYMRPRVLIADDDPDMANVVKTTLYNHADCEVVSNGLAAVLVIRESPPDALILDVNMPILGGFQVLETIRKDPVLRRLPVILLTASDDVADVRRGMELGADDYIVKPFGVNALVQRLRRVLNGFLAAGAAAEPHG